VVACDVDEAVLGNKSADEVRLIGHDGALPFPDGSFDLISAFSVLEHIEHPEVTAGELGRVLAPGGWLCAWTPNRWGYVGIGARLIPKRLHARVLRLVEPRRVEIDSFVPLYTMNTEAARKRLFPTDRFEHFTYSFDGQPFYHGENIVLGKFWELLFRLTPGPFKGYHMVFIRKRP
jgi:SAM-dependent methyltransferase